MGRSKKGGYAWRPSKGSYGIFGTHSGSERGKKARGKSSDPVAGEIKSGAQEALALLQKQYNKAYGPDNIYTKQLDLAEKEKDLSEEGFVREAEAQSGKLMAGAEAGLRETESKSAQSGFAGSGSTGRAREALAKSISTTSGDIYDTLTSKKDASDISFEGLKLKTESERESELDRIAMEASGIRSQAQQALGSLERTATADNYKFDPSMEGYNQHLSDLGVG